LRAIVFGMATTLPTGAYVVRASSAGAALGFEELKAAMNEALNKATGRGAQGSKTPSLQGTSR
jgi:RNase P protein component